MRDAEIELFFCKLRGKDRMKKLKAKHAFHTVLALFVLCSIEIPAGLVNRDIYST